MVNLEMGFEPCIPQDVALYFPVTNNTLHIYDDIESDIWSNDKEKLKLIYQSLNSCILVHNRMEIEELFK